MPKTVLVYLYEECEPIESLGTVDVLRRAGLDVTCYAKTEWVLMGHGITAKADMTGKVEKLYDAIVLPGGKGNLNLQKDDYAKELTKKHLDAGKLVCAICAAPAVALGFWGFIDGKKATCYPGKETAGLQNCIHVTDRVVVDGNIVTAKGAGVSLEFGLEVVKQLGGDWQSVKDGMLIV